MFRFNLALLISSSLLASTFALAEPNGGAFNGLLSSKNAVFAASTMWMHDAYIETIKVDTEYVGNTTRDVIFKITGKIVSEWTEDTSVKIDRLGSDNRDIYYLLRPYTTPKGGAKAGGQGRQESAFAVNIQEPNFGGHTYHFLVLNSGTATMHGLNHIVYTMADFEK